MSRDPQAFLDQMRAHLGYHETPVNITPFGDRFGPGYRGTAWCDELVSCAGEDAGMRDIIGWYAYTPAHAAWFASQGRFDRVPRVGSLVFYSWRGAAAGISGIQHVGAVEAVESATAIVTIEGNTNPTLGIDPDGGGCYRLRRSLDYVVGFGHPAYELAASSVPTPVPAPVPIHHLGDLPLVEDGQFGPETIAALQWGCGAGVDGQFGPESKKALQRHLGVSADGIIGPQTIRALQARVGAGIDGVWGSQTTLKLQQALNARRF